MTTAGGVFMWLLGVIGASWSFSEAAERGQRDWSYLPLLVAHAGAVGLAAGGAVWVVS